MIQMPRTIRMRLLTGFSVAILIPALIITVLGVGMIRKKVFAQAQTQINADLESAKEIYNNNLMTLKDAFRIHATRMVIYGALGRKGPDGLGPEMDRIRQAEGLDILNLTDATGKVFYRTRNPGAVGDNQAEDSIVRSVLSLRAPVAGTEIIPPEVLALESEDLLRQTLMTISFTPKASPTSRTDLTSGMMLMAGAPVLTPDGKFIGVLYGGILLNRNYGIVDKIRQIVFKEGTYKGREVGTATIFQDDVRISTNVRNADGSRAITTRVWADVAEKVLTRGETWRGVAFVVNDWYISAYEPIRNLQGRTVGMLYVGTLQRPFMDSLWRNMCVFLGCSFLGVVFVGLVSVRVAQRISGPIHEMALAAQKVAEGDYTQKVSESAGDEVGYLAKSFNQMTSELDRAHQELSVWAGSLERKVEERTAELKAMQTHLLQTEKLSAIGKLAAGVAHEINNPLTGILTNSSLMLQDLPPDDPKAEDLQIIVNETLRCRKIVKGLLDFARQSVPQKKPLDMNKIVEDVLVLFRNQSMFRNIQIFTDLDPALPKAMADKDQMQQVLLNLVMNAAEAMPGGGEIRFSSRPRGSGVEVRVKDNGPGISDEISHRLFEPFFTTKKSGTGLGLSIAYGIVEQHKGTIRVEASLSKGTTIVIHLPGNV